MKMKIDGFMVEVIRSNRKTASIGVQTDRTIIIRVPQRSTDKQVKELFCNHENYVKKLISKLPEQSALPYSPEEIEHFKQLASQEIPPLVQLYAQMLGVTYGKITIRCQRSKYGSCSSNGNLSFNCLLSDMPPQIMQFVVAHEVCHRLEMNHSKRFYALLQSIYPSYQESNTWLKKNGLFYISRIPK